MSELPILRLTRTDQNADGVFGAMMLPGGTVLQTCEDDWKDNAKGQSCIPAGQYVLRRTIFHKHGYETFEVAGVPGRERILVHIGNTEEDLEGCIAVGMRRGSLWIAKDEDTGEAHLKGAVVASREAFGLFMAALTHTDEAVLVVEWAPGLPLAA